MTQRTVKPPTEKLHQIIARTAIFVSEHGGQSEIVLRVKQGDNPTFGFLMPDHHLHAYFRFLVDNKELLKPDTNIKLQDEEKKIDGGGALSLLGSVYGSGEDEDGAMQGVSESKEMEPGNSVDAVNMTFSHRSDRADSSTYLAGEDKTVVKHSAAAAAAKEKTSSSKRNLLVTPASATSSKKRETGTVGSLCASAVKPDTSPMPTMSEVESLVLEPPSFLKQMVDRIVEFILKNGKEVETILIEQNITNGKFPFLLPSNQYHQYYLKALQNAQESKLPGKSLAAKKHDSLGHVAGKENGPEMRYKRDGGSSSKGSAGYVSNMSYHLEGSYDGETKGKFKMVIGAPKKDGQDQSSKPPHRPCGVSADAAAAIVLAATRGLRDPKSDNRPKTSLDDSGTGLSVSESGRTSSIGTFSFPLISRSSTPKPISNGDPGSTVPKELSECVGKSEKGGKSSGVSVARAIAKSVALVAANEADSSEAGLTREQKQKAERLKRAKMFASMIKSGSHNASELLPRLSVQAPDSALSDLPESGFKGTGSSKTNLSGVELVDVVGREREGSSAPVDLKNLDGTVEKKSSDDDYSEEERSRKKRSSRHRGHEDDSERDHKRSLKKHRSEHSSHHGREERKHKRSHSSSRDRLSQHRHKHHTSDEDEHRHRSRSDKHRRRSHAKRDLEIDDEVDRKLLDSSNIMGIEENSAKDASLDFSDNIQEGSMPSVADTRPSETTEVPDDLRAKVRAMFLATM
ncbi:SWAP (Suppressor-of-White-APricot)/surp domain-containing protein isoform X2 [Tasmannia lanceolata]|uniref:SWAP (Suppressor-of-White-APricot)/surp domain-containing protein isoform X2 n=1 Tax=Tasmannia lanceolata TaxID=3420 RepID=UPI004062A568